ncbi:MAG: hypothetical protein PHE93_03850 [Clostridia bacterium]|nr:hypothetical protein [Clostridia bacterium]
MKGKLDLFKLKELGVIDLLEDENLTKNLTKIKIDNKIYGLKFNDDSYKIMILNEISDMKRSLYKRYLFCIITGIIVIGMLGFCIFLLIE